MGVRDFFLKILLQYLCQLNAMIAAGKKIGRVNWSGAGTGRGKTETSRGRREMARAKE